LGIALIIPIFFKPSFGANVLIFTIFTNISRHITDRGLPGINKPIVIIVAAGIFAHYLYSARQIYGRRTTKQIELFLFLYFAVLVLSYYPATFKYRAIDRVISMGKDLVIIYCIIFALRQPKVWKQSIWMIIITTSVLSSFGFYQVFTGNYGQNFFGLASFKMDQVIDGVVKARLGGPINDPNLWGQVLIPVLTLVAYRIIDEPRRLVKLASILMMGLILFEVLNTYSRGAYLALLVVFVLILLERRLNPLIVLSTIGLILIIFIAAPSDYITRFESLFALFPTSEYGIYEDSSLRGRRSEILAGQRMFLDRPLLGVGAGNYENNYQQYAQDLGIELRLEEREPHSLYIQILSETGILGAVMFSGFVITLLFGLFKAKQKIHNLYREGGKSWGIFISTIQFSLVSYLITSLFLHGAYIRYFWVLAALAITCIQLTEKISNNPLLLTTYEE
jgi:O-antigen ligase